MTNRRRFNLAAAGSLALGALGMPRFALGQDFPLRKPITLIVGWPPAGVADYCCRIIAQYISPRLNQKVIVENRPGATGTLSLNQLARTAPDGYTIALTATDTQSLTPQYFEKLPYNNDDFMAVGTLAKLPMSLCVSAKTPYKDAKTLIEAARKDPGRLNYASWGNGSLAHVSMELLLKRAGATMVHVPYQGAPPAVIGLINGDVTAMVVPLSVAQSFVPKGQIRMIGTFTNERVVPEFPTLAEQGYGLEVNNWFGVIAPANTPAPIVEQLSRELAWVVEQAEVVEKLRTQGFIPYKTTPREMREMMNADYRFWGQVLKDLAIKQQ